MQRFYLRLLPYLISLFVGVLIFAVVDYITNPDLQNLVLNISAGLISVPFIFICYEFVKNFSEKKIKNKIRMYIKYHSERFFLAFIKYFYCWFFPTKNTSITVDENMIDKVLSLSFDSIEKMLTEQGLLGFFIYKDVSEDVKSFSSIVKNNNLTEYVSDVEMIHMIDMLRNITLIRKEILDFMAVGKEKSLKITKNENPHNFELMLFSKNVKIDNGMFDSAVNDRLLEYFKVPTEMIEILSHQIFDFISDTKILSEMMKIDFENDDYLYKDK